MGSNLSSTLTTKKFITAEELIKTFKLNQQDISVDGTWFTSAYIQRLNSIVEIIEKIVDVKIKKMRNT